MTTTETLPTGQELENLLREALNKLDVMRGQIIGLEVQKEQLLALVKSTAKGALVHSEKNKRLKNALALAQSMIYGGEKMSRHAESIFQDALSPTIPE